jgi:hypothetical protein
MEVIHFFSLRERTALDLSRLMEHLNEFRSPGHSASSRLEEWRLASTASPAEPEVKPTGKSGSGKAARK